MDADTGKGDFTAAAQGRFIQGGTCAGAAGAGQRVAYGAAHIAGYALGRISGHPPGYWIVWMDEDRALMGPPEFLTATPPTNNRGRIGNGVLMRVLNRTKHRPKWGCFAIVRFLGGDHIRVEERDVVTCERLVKNASYLPSYVMEHGTHYLGTEWEFQFFVDLILLRADSSFISFREAGLVKMDGGDEI